MSIAVLTTFVAKRKEEHEALVDKRNTSHEKKKNKVKHPVKMERMRQLASKMKWMLFVKRS